MESRPTKLLNSLIENKMAIRTLNDSRLKMLNRQDNGEDGKTKNTQRSTIINLIRTSTFPKTHGLSAKSNLKLGHGVKTSF